MSVSIATPSVKKPLVLNRLRHLQPFPPVVVELMRMVTEEEVRFKEIAELVGLDAAVSAEVLRMANSPVLGSHRQVNSVLHAVVMLGLGRLKGMVITVALRNFLAPVLEIPALLGCWRHNLACGVLCENLAAACYLPRDPSYTAGLLHDVGRLALLTAFPSDYVNALEMAERYHLDVNECERGVFGLDHGEAGQWLVEAWGFPEEFLEITGRHHIEPDGHKLNQVMLVYLGCQMANAAGFAVCAWQPLPSLPTLAARLPPQAWQRFTSENELATFVAEKVNALECSLMS